MGILFYNICEGRYRWNIKDIVFYVVAHGVQGKISVVLGFVLNVLRNGLMPVKEQVILENVMGNTVSIKM